MKKIKIYTFTTCGYCIMAKRVLDDNKISYEEEVITRDKVRELAKKTKSITVPQIFVDDEFIGGYTELIEYGVDKLK